MLILKSCKQPLHIETPLPRMHLEVEAFASLNVARFTRLLIQRLCWVSFQCAKMGHAGWWFRPEFIINELNINSVISTPAHDENLTLSNLEYTVRGYAYTGMVTSLLNNQASLPSSICEINSHASYIKWNRCDGLERKQRFLPAQLAHIALLTAP